MTGMNLHIQWTAFTRQCDQRIVITCIRMVVLIKTGLILTCNDRPKQANNQSIYALTGQMSGHFWQTIFLTLLMWVSFQITGGSHEGGTTTCCQASQLLQPSTTILARQRTHISNWYKICKLLYPMIIIKWMCLQNVCLCKKKKTLAT